MRKIIEKLNQTNISIMESLSMKEIVDAANRINTSIIDNLVLEEMIERLNQTNISIMESLSMKEIVDAANRINTSIIDNSAVEKMIDILNQISTSLIANNTLNEMINKVNQVNTYDFQDIILNTFDNYSTQIDLGALTNVYLASIDSPKRYSESEIELQNEEFADDIRAANINNKNYQQKIMCLIDKWKEKNPIIAKVLALILMMMINVMTNYFSSGLTLNTTRVKKSPTNTCEIVNVIDANIKITIINESRYYYEIINESEKDSIRGWVAKRNIELLNHANHTNVSE